MKAFNFVCVSCGNQLLETGLLLSSSGQIPFVCCETCRALYYIDAVANENGHPVIVVEPTNLDPKQEFDIIRNAEKRTPLREHLEKVEQPKEQTPPPSLPPHFDKDLKSAIEESVTPSDLIRSLKR